MEPRDLRSRAWAIEMGLDAEDRRNHERIAEFGFPWHRVEDSNERAMEARLLRAQAARMDGDIPGAMTFERQARNVFFTGAYDASVSIAELGEETISSKLRLATDEQLAFFARQLEIDRGEASVSKGEYRDWLRQCELYAAELQRRFRRAT
jgi:hypothetical protein